MINLFLNTLIIAGSIIAISFAVMFAMMVTLAVNMIIKEIKR